MSQHSVTVSWKVAWKACLKPEVTPKCFKNSMVVNAPLGSDSCSLSHCKDPGVHVTCQSREGHGNVLNKYMKWPDKNQYRCKHRFEVILVCPTYHLPVHCCISDCRGHLNSYAGLTITYAGMAQPVITRHHHYCLVGICLPYAHTIYKISLAANCRGGGGGGGVHRQPFAANCNAGGWGWGLHRQPFSSDHCGSNLLQSTKINSAFQQ